MQHTVSLPHDRLRVVARAGMYLPQQDAFLQRRLNLAHGDRFINTKPALYLLQSLAIPGTDERYSTRSFSIKKAHATNAQRMVEYVSHVYLMPYRSTKSANSAGEMIARATCFRVTAIRKLAVDSNG